VTAGESSERHVEQALAHALAQEERLVSLANELQAEKIAHGQSQATIKKLKTDHALEQVSICSQMRFNGTSPTLTVRFAAYGTDYALVKQIEKIFADCGWKVHLDGTNNPVLPQADQFKVIFESPGTPSFDRLAFEFSNADLLGVPVGKSMGDRSDFHHLVIKVLPSPPEIRVPPPPHQPTGAAR